MPAGVTNFQRVARLRRALVRRDSSPKADGLQAIVIRNERRQFPVNAWNNYSHTRELPWLTNEHSVVVSQNDSTITFSPC